MKKLFFTVFIVLLFNIPATKAQKDSTGKYSTGIVISHNSSHLCGITGDTITVVSGSTNLFTVDTPADSGLTAVNTNVKQLIQEIIPENGALQKYKVVNKKGIEKIEGNLVTGDHLIVRSGKAAKSYSIVVKPMALNGKLMLDKQQITTNVSTTLTLYFTAGQRSPDSKVKVFLPPGINATMNNTTVNVIGRGEVKLCDLGTQSIGRTGADYSYSRVGDVTITESEDNGKILVFSHLDLRPSNGPDLKIAISDVTLPKAGKYSFKAIYTTAKPKMLSSSGAGSETAILTATTVISNFERVIDKGIQFKETQSTYRTVHLKWNTGKIRPDIQIMQSSDKGKSWNPSAAHIDKKNARATISNLDANKLYTFRFLVKNGYHKGFSNSVQFYSGKMDVKRFGAKGNGTDDDTQSINEAIGYLHNIGGGTLLFTDGIYNVRTVHLKSNVYLFISKDATIQAIKGGDAPETTWFSDKEYRSGLSPTDRGPYKDPENYMTKQDVGHHYFRNAMFAGERLDNVKIIGNGLITGNGNLVNSDKVMNNAPDNRSDKMFALKLCTNLEIGGIYRPEDLWYDAKKDEPYYIGKDGSKLFMHDNMLKIERAGHFVLLATGTDNINMHDTYLGKYSTANVRDIYDFMGCNNVKVTNIYSKVSSDDIIKPGSDCSLGFTRPAGNYKVRNIIGDTNCNLFQIGSETADDIKNICVDNIYVLGANKAGFSISTNDGGHISNIHLNCGHTGTLHSRSKMYRTRAPFFISISNRGRILGADVGRYAFIENGIKHDELLVKNVNIGKVEHIIINSIDIAEVYGGSSYGGKNVRWKAYDGSQNKATPIIAGYKLPDPETVNGGLDFKLPDGQHTGYISNIKFSDVHILVKGGNPPSDTANVSPELGVGQYNVANLKVQPSYGIWARHVKGLVINKSTFNYEKPDGRYALFLDDVIGAQISSVKVIKPDHNDKVIKLKNSSGVNVENTVYFKGKWGVNPTKLIIK